MNIFNLSVAVPSPWVELSFLLEVVKSVLLLLQLDLVCTNFSIYFFDFFIYDFDLNVVVAFFSNYDI